MHFMFFWHLCSKHWLFILYELCRWYIYRQHWIHVLRIMSHWNILCSWSFIMYKLYGRYIH
jgi:hypothetical protein